MRPFTRCAADEYADALVASMKLGGVDHLFFCSGLEIVFYQEAIAKAAERGTPAPKLVSVTHESLALHAALGSSMVTGKPSATAAHVDLGTQNYGAAVNTAWHGRYPVLMTAGGGPRAYPGSMRGARELLIEWYQEARDQAEIVRQYTKLDHRLEQQDNPGFMVSRLLQVAMSEPRGPVYLTIPRETAMLPIAGETAFPTVDDLGIPAPPWPDPDTVRTVAKWLIEAEAPLVDAGQFGRNPSAVEELVRLAELLALPVRCRGFRMAFPTTHPLFDSAGRTYQADMVLVLENLTPFKLNGALLRPDAKVVFIDTDPVHSRYKTFEFRSDAWLVADSGCALRAIFDAATSMLTSDHRRRIEERRAALEASKRQKLAQRELLAQQARASSVLDPVWVQYQVGRMLEPDMLLVDNTVGAPEHKLFLDRSLPGTYFASGASGGGFGPGAALGAKLAAPERDVVHVTGDGFFIFGEPVSALLAAVHHKAPFLTVVYVNRSYSTGTFGLRHFYPDGAAVRLGRYDGGLFDPAPDFAKLAESVGAYGETVTTAEQVGPALGRGLAQVRNGVPAVIAAQLPTLVETPPSQGRESCSTR